MNPAAADEHFARIIEAPAEERDDLVASIPDPATRDEVRRLLLHHGLLTTDPKSIAFLQALDLGLASQLVDAGEAQPERIGRFEVLRLIGRGASGTVYLARDPELGREVAVKLLASDLSSSPSATRRFKEEARAASMLDHPNVVTVFEVGQTDDGRLFIAMAYHAGETLRDRLRRGTLPLEDALGVAVEVAEGLAAAHSRGIVHRDVKPENILLTDHGTRIVDFGIAKVLRDSATLTGATIGTAAYMSPEQTRGDDIDQRTDLWSLGVVLYEMLAGSRPFQADSGDALVYGIRHDEPISLQQRRPDLPVGIAQLVDRCLAKRPDDRFQTARELVDALMHRSFSASTRNLRRTRNRALGASMVVALALAGWWWYRTATAGTTDPLPAPGVAVLPWRVTGSEISDLHEGMVDLLSYSIDGVPGLRKIDPLGVMAAWRSQGEPTDQAERFELAQRVGASYLVTGSAVQLSNGSVSLIAEVRDVRRNRVRGSAQVEGPQDSISTLVDQLTMELLRRNLIPYDGNNQPASLGALTTKSLPALKALLAGEREYRLGRWAEAARHYLQALEHDPAFARALYRLIKANDMGAALGGNQGYLARLEPLVPGLPDRDRMLIMGEMGSRFPNWNLSSQMPQLLILDSMLIRFPDEVEGWIALGDRQFHDRGQLLLPAGGFRDAFRRAISLNPYYSEPYLHLLEDSFFRRDSAEALQLAAEFARIDRGPRQCSMQLAVDLAWGSPPARRAAAAALDTIPAISFWDCLPRFGTYPVAPEVREKIWARVRDALGAVELPNWASPYFTFRLRGLAGVGQIAPIRDDLAGMERRSGTDSWWPERVQLMLHLSGFPDSVTAHRAAHLLVESPPTAPGPSITAPMFVGLLAASEGRWADAEAMTSILDSLANVIPDVNGIPMGQAASADANALRAYMALARGGVDQLPAMDTALAHAHNLSIISPVATLRWLVGNLLKERGELEEARRYFRSFGTMDLIGTRAELSLGQVNEQLGRHEDAIANYRLFLAWWRDADPEYQSLVAEAREGLRRLGVTAP